ncbi:MAG: DNA polymerase I [bacterium]
MFGKKLYLIDATAFCYRAFYALKGFSTSFGQPTNAIYGFINILKKIIKEGKPDYLAVCFDVSRDTFRQKKFKEYKIQRPPMPDGLSSQIPLIKEIVRAYGLALFEKEGFEADDIIATLAKKAGENGLACVIVSSDKDMLQLVDENTQVFSPYEGKGIFYDKNKVSERFGVLPGQIPELIALVGDVVDNIPGVRGIGDKTAVQLLNSFGSLNRLLEDYAKIKQEKIKGSISENLEMIKLNLELASLDSKVGIDFDLDKARIADPDIGELYRIFKYLEFKRFLKNLPQQQGEQEQVQFSIIDEKELKSLLSKEKEFFFWGDSLSELTLGVNGKVFKLKNPAGQIKEALSDPKIKKSSHNLKKAKVGLFKEGVILEGLGFDTMIAAYLINPSGQAYSLSDLAWDYLGLRVDSPLDNAVAVSLLMKLKPKLDKELNEKSLDSLFTDLEMPLVEVLAKMELCGIKIDLGLLRQLSKDIEKRLVKLIDKIYSLSGCEFNINSPKQLREILFEKLKLPVIKKTKTGPSTDEEVLRALSGKNELPALLLEYRQLTKLKNTYIDALPELVDKKSGRVHTSFNQTGTETGRLSSSNPNLQNIPIKTDIGSNIRRAIIASGSRNYLLSCDYSQIELRILAHLSKDEALIEAFKEGKDIHRITASLICGLDEKEVDDNQRNMAKRVNFGIVYGLTSYGLSRDLGISVDEAGRFIEAYFARYPRVEDYIQKQIEKAGEDGFVTTLLGRRRYIPQINNKNQALRQFAERQAVNTPIQGSASDLIKLAMVQIQRKLDSGGFKSTMILQIHDELLFDVAQPELKEVAALVKDSMEHVLKLDVPIRVDIKMGKNWLEMKEVE